MDSLALIVHAIEGRQTVTQSETFENIYVLLYLKFSVCGPECPFRGDMWGSQRQMCGVLLKGTMKGAERDETVPCESLPMNPEGGRLPPTKVIKCSES